MFMRRRIGNDCVGHAAVGDFVLPHLQRHWRDRSHRLDTFDLNFGQLLNEGENCVEFAAKIFNFALSDRDSGKMGDTADGVIID